MTTPRERAARALCREAGLPEDMTLAGQRMWMCYLDEVDIVLKAALDPKQWERIRGPRHEAESACPTASRTRRI
jgi:hypothetical protein